VAAAAHLHGRGDLVRAQRALEADAVAAEPARLRLEVVDLHRDVVEADALAGGQALAGVVEAQQLEPAGAEREERRTEAVLVDAHLGRLAELQDLACERARRLEVVHQDPHVIESHGGQLAQSVGMTDLRLERLPPSDPRAGAALRAFMADVVSSYQGRPATEEDLREAFREFPSDGLEPPDGLFLVALRGEEVIGCGGVRFVAPGLGEVTRVHVVPEQRRRGVARRLMAELERCAREHGVRELRLDTRADLVEARALYARLGYREVPRFSEANPYAAHWFAKTLD
jgi:ribosomal protein S18 acetylase RimI-like enzyme